MQMMVTDPVQQKDVQAISILVQYIAQKVGENDDGLMKRAGI